MNNQMVSLGIMIKLFIQALIISGILSQNIHAMPDVSKALQEVSFTTTTQKSLKLDKYQGKVILVFFVLFRK